MLQGVDAAGNACPSLHVAVATFTVIRLRAVLRQIGAPVLLHAINTVWFVAIALSTLATKQHVVLDVVAGALLGTGFALLSLRWRPREAAAARAGPRALDTVRCALVLRGGSARCACAATAVAARFSARRSRCASAPGGPAVRPARAPEP